MAYDGPFDVAPEVLKILDRAPALFIDGRYVRAASDALIEARDPSSGKVIAQVADADAQDVDRAVQSAHAAFTDGRWRHMPPAQRERILLRFADLIEARAETMAQLETLNQGKSIALSRMFEVEGSLGWIRFAAGLATKITGRSFDLSLPGGPNHWRSYTLRDPIGVVGAIAPWNFPMAIALWKVMPALAAGCSVVLKPSEFTPLTALVLAEIASEAGIPDGVFNVVSGGRETGAALVAHPLIAKISFTGSTPTGKAIGKVAMDRMARVTLELGGKNPSIVLDDADLAKVVPGLFMGNFLNAGQMCASSSRVYVTHAMYEPLTEALHGALSGATVGAGLDPEMQINPLTSQAQKSKVLAYLDDARSGGAEILAGAQAPDEGYYVSPHIVRNPKAAVRLTQEEVFGPVINITPVADLDEALMLANDTAFGLAASVWTEDLGSAMRATDALRAGTIWVNSHVFIDPAMPFGGYQQSGVGRDFGVDWLDAYTEVKSVCISY